MMRLIFRMVVILKKKNMENNLGYNSDHDHMVDLVELQISMIPFTVCKDLESMFLKA